MWRVEDRGFETPCHIWTGPTSKKGYPRWYRPGRSTSAHRSIYEDAHNIRLPSYIHVHHRCEVKLCVNPEHMRHLTDPEHKLEHPPYITLGKPRPGDPMLSGRPPTPAIPQSHRGPNRVIPWRARAAANRNGGST